MVKKYRNMVRNGKKTSRGESNSNNQKNESSSRTKKKIRASSVSNVENMGTLNQTAHFRNRRKENLKRRKKL